MARKQVLPSRAQPASRGRGCRGPEGLLGDAIPQTSDWFDQLVRLTVVERFHAHEAWNVHEVTRLALRDRLAEDQPERFRALSARAAALVPGAEWSQAVERVYHLLTSAPDDGADELSRLWKKWYRAGKLQPLQALGRSLDELCSRDLLEPKPRAYALVALGAIRPSSIPPVLAGVTTPSTTGCGSVDGS